MYDLPTIVHEWKYRYMLYTSAKCVLPNCFFFFVLTQRHGAASQDGPQKEHSGELEAGTYSERHASEMLLTASRHLAEADISVK